MEQKEVDILKPGVRGLDCSVSITTVENMAQIGLRPTSEVIYCFRTLIKDQSSQYPNMDQRIRYDLLALQQNGRLN